uniref:Ubiquitin-like domain-containing CTD phosphatase 1 n=1 Tax=Cacopsylla melanoneura TaxID=428564 RepID=A0A8D8QF88_9HEMI
MEDPINLTIKWNSKEYKICLSKSHSVLELKQEIHKQTGVKSERQKILNLKHAGKPPSDEVKLSETNVTEGFKLMVMGSLEESIQEASSKPVGIPEIVDDFDIEEDQVAIENKDIYLDKIKKRIKDYQINVLNEPRPGKKLLVLDIDYTLFDHRSAAEQGYELMRPFLHEFLTSAYKHYDIAIWSATSMKWIEEKMKLLGVTVNPNYKIVFYVDCSAMISVHLPKYGVVEVKPLGVIWGKFSSSYSPQNTIMFDDIRRNFLMNPRNGLRIRPFREAHLNRGSDRELKRLARYLDEIASLDDLTALNHRNWEKYLHVKHKERKRSRRERERLRESGGHGGREMEEEDGEEEEEEGEGESSNERRGEDVERGGAAGGEKENDVVME